MIENKGVRTLIEAHRIVKDRGIALRLLLAGTPDLENPASISETELSSWNGLDGVEWVGHVNDISSLWAKAHIALLPSKGGEGVPKSLLEAAALGRPMIATDTPGCREIAINDVTAITHPIDDAVAIADALEILCKNKQIRQQYGAAARQLAVNRFSNAIVGSQTLSLYNTLISDCKT